MLQIDYINGRNTQDIFGTSKYNNEINRRIKGINLNHIEYPKIGNIRVIDGLMKRFIYPIIIRSKIRQNIVKHVTNQDLAFILLCMDLHPAIVTCYDLIPVTWYHSTSLYWKMNLKGLQNADHIITISEFSKEEIIRVTEYPGENITVIYPGVDKSTFFPNRNRAILDQHNIPEKNKIILFVGSEEPRKNISLLINALNCLKKKVPDITLLKVGGSQMGGDRTSLTKLIHKLGLENNVKFIGHVPEHELPLYYNASDLFVFPSLYEGFGLPPLEAMSCGCPVLCANTTSLPEVTGNNPELLFKPQSPADLASKMENILFDKNQREKNVEIGLKQVNKFSWDLAAIKVKELYNEIQVSIR